MFEKLEFDRILQELLKLCLSELGQEYVKNIRFSADRNFIQTQLNQLNDYILLLENNEQFPQDSYFNLQKELDRLKLLGSVLTIEEIFRIFKFLKLILNVFLFFEKKLELYPNLYELIKDYRFNKSLINVIKAVMDDDGKIKSNATPTLVQIRKQLSFAYKDLTRKFGLIIKDYAERGFLTPEKESVKAGKRVLAVLSEHKRKVKGLILDVTNSGKVTFIEPEAVMQINNDITELHLSEKREIYKILKNLTITLQPHIEYISNFQKIIGLFDFIRSKAIYANQIDAITPKISENYEIILREAYHPILKKINKTKGKTTVPLNVDLNRQKRILMISGPNAGGKSVALKTIGLLQLMMQCGLAITANEGSELPIFRQFFVDIGDEQSLDDELSTYSSRLKNMNHFCTFADAKTIVIMDEFGAGTDPAFGGAIAEAIIENLNKKNVFAVLTTHFSNLKIFAENNSYFLSANMIFDKEALTPKYILEIGKPGSSYAFELAEKIGMRQFLIDAAKGKIEEGIKDYDKLLVELQKEKVAVAKNKADLQKEKTKYNSLIETYEEKKNELVKNKNELKKNYQLRAAEDLENLNKKFENLIKEWTEDKNEKEKIKKFKYEVEQEKQKLSKAKEKLQNQIKQKAETQSKQKGEIKIGSWVTLINNPKTKAKVLQLRKKSAIIQFGAFKTEVKLNEIIGSDYVEKENLNSGFSRKLNLINEAATFDNTLDVRGQSMVDAIKEVETFVDKALMLNYDMVKILHGKGSGVLRTNIRRYLKNLKAVENYQNELPEFGGDGITVVNFR